MAKKGNRVKFGLICETCKSHNYVTEKNKVNTKEGLKINKYCFKCRQHTSHKELKKLD